MKAISGSAVGVIPARMASTRFPGKPMAELLGMPMIGHCWHRSSMATALDHLVVATCDDEIARYISKIGGRAVMTSADHQTASDRTAEAIEVLESEGLDVEVVVMIQGDEPLVRPEMIELAVTGLRSPGAVIANLCVPIAREDSTDPNEIKVAIDGEQRALYMSRASIPYDRDGSGATVFKQVCIIPFQREFLTEFNQLARTPLEVAESIDMFRAMENGYTVHMVPIDSPMKSVDTPDDLRAAEALLSVDILAPEYL